MTEYVAQAVRVSPSVSNHQFDYHQAGGEYLRLPRGTRRTIGHEQNTSRIPRLIPSSSVGSQRRSPRQEPAEDEDEEEDEDDRKKEEDDEDDETDDGYSE